MSEDMNEVAASVGRAVGVALVVAAALVLALVVAAPWLRPVAPRSTYNGPVIPTVSCADAAREHGIDVHDQCGE